MNSTAASRFFPDNGSFTPRFREAGDVTLDLLHRDGRIDDRWLLLDAVEFDLLWCLAEEAGKRVPKERLLAAIGRLELEAAQDGIAIHVMRIRAKLESSALEALILAHPDSGYYIDVPEQALGFAPAASD